MLPIYHSGLAPRLEARINVPDLSQTQAEEFVRSLVKSAAVDAVRDDWTWKRFRTQNGDRWFTENDKRHLWAKSSALFKTAVCGVAGQAIYNQIIGLTGANPNVLKGINALSLDTCTSAVREAIAQYEILYEAGDVPKPPEAQQPIDPLSAILSRSVICDMRKSLDPDQLPNIENFVPRSQEALELYKSTGKVPAGYLDLEMIKSMSPGYAYELALANVPMLKASYFEKNVAERVAADMTVNEEKWAAFLSTFVPIDDTGLEKGHTSEQSLLERLSGSDEVRSMELVENHTVVLESLAKAFGAVDKSKLHDLVKSFSGDASAVVGLLSLMKCNASVPKKAGMWEKDTTAVVGDEDEKPAKKSKAKKSNTLEDLVAEADALVKGHANGKAE